jgi:hypothetical protein
MAPLRSTFRAKSSTAFRLHVPRDGLLSDEINFSPLLLLELRPLILFDKGRNNDAQPNHPAPETLPAP